MHPNGKETAMSDNNQFPEGLFTATPAWFGASMSDVGVDVKEVARTAFREFAQEHPYHANRLVQCYGCPLQQESKRYPDADYVKRYAVQEGINYGAANGRLMLSFGRYRTYYLNRLRTENKLARIIALEAAGRHEEAIALVAERY
jgi:hypothetical protein